MELRYDGDVGCLRGGTASNPTSASSESSSLKSEYAQLVQTVAEIDLNEREDTEVGELLPEKHRPARVVPVLLYAVLGLRREDTFQGQGLDEERDISVGIREFQQPLHSGMQGVRLNGHSELAPDVKAGRGEENARGECASREGVDVVMEEVKNVLCRLNREDRSHNVRSRRKGSMERLWT